MTGVQRVLFRSPVKSTAAVVAPVAAGVGYMAAKKGSDQASAKPAETPKPSAPSNATALAKDAQSKGQKILPSTGYDKGAGGEAAPMSNAPKPSAPRPSTPSVSSAGRTPSGEGVATRGSFKGMTGSAIEKQVSGGEPGSAHAFKIGRAHV